MAATAACDYIEATYQEHAPTAPAKAQQPIIRNGDTGGSSQIQSHRFESDDVETTVALTARKFGDPFARGIADEHECLSVGQPHSFLSCTT